MNHKTMYPSKVPKNDYPIKPLSNNKLDDDLALKLEIWENEGGAINPSDVDPESSEQ